MSLVLVEELVIERFQARYAAGRIVLQELLQKVNCSWDVPKCGHQTVERKSLVRRWHRNFWRNLQEEGSG